MTNPHENAYPSPEHYGEGLSKRELFAAMAMQGYCSNPDTLSAHGKQAESAVQQADALIAELNKD